MSTAFAINSECCFSAGHLFGLVVDGTGGGGYGAAQAMILKFDVERSSQPDKMIPADFRGVSLRISRKPYVEPMEEPPDILQSAVGTMRFFEMTQWASAVVTHWPLTVDLHMVRVRRLNFTWDEYDDDLIHVGYNDDPQLGTDYELVPGRHGDTCNSGSSGGVMDLDFGSAASEPKAKAAPKPKAQGKGSGGKATSMPPPDPEAVKSRTPGRKGKGAKKADLSSINLAVDVSLELSDIIDATTEAGNIDEFLSAIAEHGQTSCNEEICAELLQHLQNDEVTCATYEREDALIAAEAGVALQEDGSLVAVGETAVTPSSSSSGAQSSSSSSGAQPSSSSSGATVVPSVLSPSAPPMAPPVDPSSAILQQVVADLKYRLPDPATVASLPKPPNVEMTGSAVHFTQPDGRKTFIGRINPMGDRYLKASCNGKCGDKKACNLFFTSVRHWEPGSLAERNLMWWLLHGHLRYTTTEDHAGHEKNGKDWRKIVYAAPAT